MSSKATILILASCLVGLSVSVSAQPQQSANFRITKSVLDDGGQSCASANFHVVSVLGQPSPVGSQASSNFVLYGGFLSPAFGVASFSSIQRLVIVPQGSDAVLFWEAVPGAVQYKVYRSADPSFEPSPTTLVGSVSTPTFTDANISSVASKNFYIVTALNANGLAMAPIRRQVAAKEVIPAPATAVIKANAPALTPRRQAKTVR